MIQTIYRRNPTLGERFFNPSKTIPDQTMSLKTILTKYSKGMPINAPDNGQTYTGEKLAVNFAKLDLTEQEEIVLEAAAELSELKGKKAREDAERLAEATKKANEAENLRKELDELKAKQSINNP